MNQKIVWAEMARRKIQFHYNEEWQNIRLWGLFQWEDVSSLLKSGKLLTHMKKENRTIWVTPSPDAYHDFIEPLLEKYTLDELSIMAGW